MNGIVRRVENQDDVVCQQGTVPWAADGSSQGLSCPFDMRHIPEEKESVNAEKCGMARPT
jgi:hypothetical protein